MSFLNKVLFLLTLSLLIGCATQQKKPAVKRKEKPVAAAPSLNTPYTTYKVSKGESLSAIARKNNVTIQDIVKMNPGLRDPIAVGSLIKIPYLEVISDDSTPEKSYEVLNVALLLPFGLDNISFSSEEEEATDSYNSKLAAPVEFYQGALLALDSLKKQGFSSKVKVYDVNDSLKLKSILPELKDVQLIIGPFSNTMLRPVAVFAKQENIAVVSPLTTLPNNSMTNPQLAVAVPSVNTQCRQMALFVANSFNRENIIVVHQGNRKEIEQASIFKNVISQKTLKEVKVVQSYKDVLAQLSPDKKNVIIAPSSNEAFVTQLVNVLNPKKDKFNITLVGLPTWEDFETLDYQILENLNTYLFKSVHVNLADPKIKSFQKKYVNEFKTYPSNYSYQGFGLMYYYGSNFISAKKNFFIESMNYKTELPHTRFNFERYSGTGAMENQYIHIFKVKDFELQKLN